ncbi:MAG: hypothetical protein IJA30_01710 [Bacilli bacterium]|nr:hypothetical protein [Bacilli bacterium]
MNEILEKVAIILDNHYQDEYVDEEFLKAIFDDVVELQGTRKYVENGLTMSGEAPMLFAAGGYDKKEKKIKFFDTTLRDTKYEVNVYIKGIPEDKKVFATNVLLITTLLHELEHVNQEKMKEFDDSYEADLLRLEEGKEETISTYELIPGERFAESKALSSALSLLDKSIVYCPVLQNYLEQKRNLCLIKGYEDTYNSCQSYPIKQYMDKHNIEHAPISVEESIQTEFDLNKRLFIGLPITEEEYRTTREKAGLKNSSDGYTI